MYTETINNAPRTCNPELLVHLILPLALNHRGRESLRAECPRVSGAQGQLRVVDLCINNTSRPSSSYIDVSSTFFDFCCLRRRGLERAEGVALFLVQPAARARPAVVADLRKGVDRL
eukprot:768229-Hanusia_phi.AAC.2